MNIRYSQIAKEIDMEQLGVLSQQEIDRMPFDKHAGLEACVKEFFENYLNRVEESDSGYLFHPITVSCCRAAMLEPLDNLLNRMAQLAGAERKNAYDLK